MKRPNEELIQFLEERLVQAKSGELTKMAGFYRTAKSSPSFAFDLDKNEAVGWLLVAAGEFTAANRWMPPRKDDDV